MPFPQLQPLSDRDEPIERAPVDVSLDAALVTDTRARCYTPDPAV